MPALSHYSTYQLGKRIESSGTGCWVGGKKTKKREEGLWFRDSRLPKIKMCLSMFFQPVEVGATGDLIRKSGLANMWLVPQRKRYSGIKWIWNERIVLQSSIWTRSFDQIKPCILLESLKHSITIWSKEAILPLVLVQPHFECCVQFWTPQYRRDVKVLERAQRKARKLVTGLEDMSCEERLRTGLEKLSRPLKTWLHV